MAAAEGIPPLKELEEISKPYQILDMDDGESQDMTVVDYALGKGHIKPARAPEGVTVPILRVQVPSEERPRAANWWDITSKTLIAQMLPALDTWKADERTVTVTKYGRAPSARFGLEVP